MRGVYVAPVEIYTDFALVRQREIMCCSDSCSSYPADIDNRGPVTPALFTKHEKLNTSFH